MPGNMNPKQNNEIIARCGLSSKENLIHVIFLAKSVRVLKNYRILITTTQSQCRQHGHIEGGHDFR